jgi:hypothetical protein
MPEQELGQMAEHRVSMLTTPLRRYEDPAKSRDPRVQAVLAQFKTMQAEPPPPRAHFRAELRAQLVAVAPRIIAESGELVDIVPRPHPRPSPRPRVPAPAHAPESARPLAWLRKIPIARPLSIAASVITVFALLLGGAVWMSQKALPGDALYGLKRASENVRIAMASNNVERARDYLDLAATRVDEAKSLVSRTSASASGTGTLADGSLSSHTAGLVTSNLSSADSDVKSASKLLGGQAVKSGSTVPLANLTKWAPKQLQRLTQLAAAIPNSELRSRTTSSTHLVHAALSRAQTLQSKVDCSCMSSSGSDDLGPVPCTVCTSPATKPGTNPNPAKTTGHSGKKSTKTGVTVPGQGATNSTGASGNGTQGGTSSTAPNAPPSLSGLPLPSLPIKLPKPTTSLPITLGSCGLGITIGPIDLHLGSCPSS